jgi:hypothetical protein
MIHAPAFGVATAAILGRRHVCRLTPAGVRRSAARTACWPAQRSGSRRWGLSLVSGRSPQSPCITAIRHARAMAHPHRRELPQTNGGANGCTTWHPNVTCRRRFDSCVSPIDQGASSAGRSAVAETWLRNTASTPGARAHRRRPADRAQAFPAGRTALPSGLVSDGPRRSGSAVDGWRRGVEPSSPLPTRISPSSRPPSGALLFSDAFKRLQPHGPGCLHESGKSRSF